jgi:hypothetical protein
VIILLELFHIQRKTALKNYFSELVILVYNNYLAENMFLFIRDRAAAVVGKRNGTAEKVLNWTGKVYIR